MRRQDYSGPASTAVGRFHPGRRDSNPALLLVVVVASLVHCCAARAAGIDGPVAALPQHVAEMRDMILAAAKSGKLDDLKSALEISDVSPDTGLAPADDAIAAFKAASADGEGREILAVMAEILEMPPAALPLGKDLENNLIYVWPYLSERPIEAMTPKEQVELYRLVPHAKVVEMREKKRWTWWRLIIAADGTWQLFKKPD
jgi:hypothetical protein